MNEFHSLRSRNEFCFCIFKRFLEIEKQTKSNNNKSTNYIKADVVHLIVLLGCCKKKNLTQINTTLRYNA